MLCSCGGEFPSKKGGYRYLRVLGLSSEAVVGSLSRTPVRQSQLEKIGKKYVWQIHFNEKRQ